MGSKNVIFLLALCVVWAFGTLQSAVASAIPPVTNLASTSHTVGAVSGKNSISVLWTASSAPNLLGYATEWSDSSTCNPVTINLSPSIISISSPLLSDGTWSFCIRAVDIRGNFSPVSVIGPFPIDTSPEIIAISPSHGGNNRPTNVTITGTGFQNGASVKIADIIMVVHFIIEPTTIQAVVPANLLTGAYDMTVTNPNGKSFTFSASDPGQGGFTVTPSPAAPIAEAGPDQIVFDSVTLDGRGSSSSPGAIVSYSWVLEHRENPAWSQYAHGPVSIVTGLHPGFYNVTLEVENALNLKGTDTMTLAAMNVNNVIAHLEKGDFDQDNDVDGEDLNHFSRWFGWQGFQKEDKDMDGFTAAEGGYE